MLRPDPLQGLPVCSRSLLLLSFASFGGMDSLGVLQVCHRLVCDMRDPAGESAPYDGLISYSTACRYRYFWSQERCLDVSLMSLQTLRGSCQIPSPALPDGSPHRSHLAMVDAWRMQHTRCCVHTLRHAHASFCKHSQDACLPVGQSAAASSSWLCAGIRTRHHSIAETLQAAIMKLGLEGAPIV